MRTLIMLEFFGDKAQNVMKSEAVVADVACFYVWFNKSQHKIVGLVDDFPFGELFILKTVVFTDRFWI